jgi:chromosome segregation protein
VKIENKLQQLLIEKEHFNKSIHDLQRQLEIGQKELLQLEEKKANASQSLIKCEDQLVNKYNEKETFTKDLSAFEQAYFNARGEIHQWEEEQKKLNRIQQQDQLLVNQYKDVLVALRFEREKIEERVRVEFNEQIHNWKIPESLMGIDKNELEIEVDRLEKKLQSFSEVNPLALEAYEELELRYENILKQRDDILAAKEDLLNTIKEIENKATRLFLDAFEEVRKYFVKVFRSLFTEDDDCDLVLLDPSDPLNSEIEILAKPKGKRPKSLSQLSGGEKTLTATALLFSLYLLKPAPFCIFDEVDAPLDDNNVQKFGNIIRAFSKESQFLMITHNKLTMAEVDILYGIFMQEKGISQVAPVDLTMLAHENRIGELLK